MQENFGLGENIIGSMSNMVFGGNVKIKNSNTKSTKKDR